MRYPIRFLALVIVSTPLIAAPASAASNSPSPSVSSKNGGSVANPNDGYRAAYSRLGAHLLATVYDRQDYAAAIDQLKALGRDDEAAVANLLGYCNRKLGNYKLAQVWYERSLKADPNHVKTWQYYGMWQIEQGNREQAQYHLEKIAELAGVDSEEYLSLAAVLEQPPGKSIVY